MPIENGRRELGYLEGQMEGLKDSIERIDTNIGRIFERIDEDAKEREKEAHGARITGLESRVGRIEKTGIGALLSSVGMFIKLQFFGK